MLSISAGMKLTTATCVFPYEFKLISMIPDMVLETPMYALLTQLLDIPNYRVVSAEIETDKITLDIEGISIARDLLWDLYRIRYPLN